MERESNISIILQKNYQLILTIFNLLKNMKCLSIDLNVCYRFFTSIPKISIHTDLYRNFHKFKLIDYVLLEWNTCLTYQPLIPNTPVLMPTLELFLPSSCGPHCQKSDSAQRRSGLFTSRMKFPEYPYSQPTVTPTSPKTAT